MITEVVVLLVGKLRSEANLSRLDGNLVTYIGVGLVVIGAILSIIFVVSFVLKQGKHQ